MSFVSRAGMLLALVALGLGPASPVTAQPAEPADPAAAWRFGHDAFADLWFHGLALVEFHGSGHAPLYDPSYRARVLGGAAVSGGRTTTLDLDAPTIGAAFRSDPAFEVLHFVPLYFSGMGVEAAIADLQAAASGSRGGESRGAGAALASVLHEPIQRQALGAFLRALREERSRVSRTGWRSEPERVQELAALWSELTRGDLGEFLDSEGFQGGTVWLTDALGPEGRFLDTPSGPLVAIGVDTRTSASGAAGALLRELCYPTVRRALAGLEHTLDSRRTASDVSDRAATRCGELLLSEYAPSLLPTYRSRFGLTAQDAGFLSTPGLTSDVAALESLIDEALRSDLNLNGRERTNRSR